MTFHVRMTVVRHWIATIELGARFAFSLKQLGELFMAFGMC